MKFDRRTAIAFISLSLTLFQLSFCLPSTHRRARACPPSLDASRGPARMRETKREEPPCQPRPWFLLFRSASFSNSFLRQRRRRRTSLTAISDFSLDSRFTHKKKTTTVRFSLFFFFLLSHLPSSSPSLSMGHAPPPARALSPTRSPVRPAEARPAAPAATIPNNNGNSPSPSPIRTKASTPLLSPSALARVRMASIQQQSAGTPPAATFATDDIRITAPNVELAPPSLRKDCVLFYYPVRGFFCEFSRIFGSTMKRQRRRRNVGATAANGRNLDLHFSFFFFPLTFFFSSCSVVLSSPPHSKQDTEELAHKIVRASGNGVELGEINWA